MSMVEFQPDLWCGARPCGECRDLTDCVLGELDQPSKNALGILIKLNELNTRRGKGKNNKEN